MLRRNGRYPSQVKSQDVHWHFENGSKAINLKRHTSATRSCSSPSGDCSTLIRMTFRALVSKNLILVYSCEWFWGGASNL